APVVKDPNRVADPSTLRRRFRDLDSSPTPYGFLRKTVAAASHWLARGEVLRHSPLSRSWRTVVPFLRQLWPLLDYLQQRNWTATRSRRPRPFITA
ncbi:MAG: hypothetical protein AAB225_28805, partial [Acidobacteriota bacterium]